MAGGRQIRTIRGRISIYLLAFFFAVICGFPFLWATLTAFKQDPDLYSTGHNPFAFTMSPTLDNITTLFTNTPYLQFILNSVIIGLVATAITLVLSIPAAYALARLTGRWGIPVAIGIFVVYLVPPTLLFLPMSRIITVLGLQDSIWSLIVVYPGFTIPLSVWLLVGFFRSVPPDIEEQAQVDGYTRIGAMVRVVLPLITPGLFTVVVFSFTLTMQDFIYALAFVSSSSNMTISVGVPTNLVRGDVFFWQSLMASAIIVAVPIALVYNIFLRKFIQGFTLGAVKG
ncbi:carbohydrate ABC transporter permease [Leekyejoonella antrihumi]|uniref:Carbohydrate ABC transporter permease n=1 Tax=Leekyejoonella antrihumi TaxID=1660198 RepID=A0A563E7Z1_9MICO|nr:carbohydrate ABC transporter permease [Leekyejoonella antrihumi]TWP38698.1 carbohydrate ABC transporter permease [Leekyejoonella antrihumi]